MASVFSPQILTLANLHSNIPWNCTDLAALDQFFDSVIFNNFSLVPCQENSWIDLSTPASLGTALLSIQNFLAFSPESLSEPRAASDQFFDSVIFNNFSLVPHQENSWINLSMPASLGTALLSIQNFLVFSPESLSEPRAGLGPSSASTSSSSG
ncbi:hypothetical protein AZE42_12148 [Rhizopogon vesiculosus]|uniref:Uncharacterized protein n=1 Tax=Rhizopogon vesiculosus TaxID=180088 RepID=A0A1J8QKL2_9AGAM|nr:hypothetical protein AZE42_12148 [Rhizopogon vesiculosus]